MRSIKSSREIEAPLEFVFATISDPRSFAKAVPDIVDVEFLTERQRGEGTRFRETRMMHGREATVELEVAELVENDHIRIVAKEGGSVWDSTFTLQPTEQGAELTLEMHVRAYKW